MHTGAPFVSDGVAQTIESEPPDDLATPPHGERRPIGLDAWPRGQKRWPGVMPLPRRGFAAVGMPYGGIERLCDL